MVSHHNSVHMIPVYIAKPYLILFALPLSSTFLISYFWNSQFNFTDIWDSAACIKLRAVGILTVITESSKQYHGTHSFHKISLYAGIIAYVTTK